MFFYYNNYYFYDFQDRNLHQSYTEPPKYPHFQKKMNRKDAKTKQTTRTNAETNTTTSVNYLYHYISLTVQSWILPITIQGNYLHCLRLNQ